MRTCLLWVITLLIGPWVPVWAASVELTWNLPTTNADGTPLTDLAGIRIYWGAAPDDYDTVQDVGLTTSATILEVPAGVTSWFTVTAYDRSGNESLPHPPISATPLLPTIGPALSLTPTGDTLLNLDRTTYGREPWLGLYTWPDRQIANVTLLQFSLSELPTGARVESAVLSLVLLDSDGAPEPYTVSAHALLRRWVEGEATGARRTRGSPWLANRCCYGGFPMAQRDIGPAVATTPVGIIHNAYTWDITALVRDWWSGATLVHGVLLNADTRLPADRYRTFASREHPDASWHPHLLVTYTLP